VKEYKKRSLIAYVNSFGISDKVYIDGAAMEQVFDKYKATDGAPESAPVNNPSPGQ
jgi:hypothetical protein